MSVSAGEHEQRRFFAGPVHDTDAPTAESTCVNDSGGRVTACQSELDGPNVLPISTSGRGTAERRVPSAEHIACTEPASDDYEQSGNLGGTLLMHLPPRLQAEFMEDSAVCVNDGSCFGATADVVIRYL